jgi:hypothetical protein
MIDIDGRHKGDNPVRGDLEVTWHYDDIDDVTETIPAPAPENNRTALAQPTAGVLSGVTVTDPYGNTGSFYFPR